MAAIELSANGRPKVVETDDGNVVDLSAIDVSPLGPPQSAPARTATVEKAIEPKALTAAQLTRDIRARLKVVRKEIALRKRLEREEQQLVRLLKAVSEKPTTVRPIRATG